MNQTEQNPTLFNNQATETTIAAATGADGDSNEEGQVLLAKKPVLAPDPETTWGPQFAGSYGGWGEKVNDWLKKHFLTVVLPIFALAVLVSGVYSYVAKKQNVLTKPVSVSEKIATKPESVAGEAVKSKLEISQPQTGKSLEITTGGAITQKAQKGEGVTHLTRKALRAYLAKNLDEAANLDLTLEQKIYIEDFLKDSVGSKSLEAGEEVKFSKELIKEAISQAKNLGESQLLDLNQYVVQTIDLY